MSAMWVAELNKTEKGPSPVAAETLDGGFGGDLFQSATPGATKAPETFPNAFPPASNQKPEFAAFDAFPQETKTSDFAAFDAFPVTPEQNPVSPQPPVAASTTTATFAVSFDDAPAAEPAPIGQPQSKPLEFNAFNDGSPAAPEQHQTVSTEAAFEADFPDFAANPFPSPQVTGSTKEVDNKDKITSHDPFGDSAFA